MGEAELAALDLFHVEPEHGEIGPVIPASELGADTLEVREGDIHLHGARADDVGIGEDKAVGRQNHSGANARSVPPGAGLEGELAHVDPHHRIQQAVKPPAHCGLRRDEGEAVEEKKEG